MSLELKIEQLTTAIKALTEILIVATPEVLLRVKADVFDKPLIAKLSEELVIFSDNVLPTIADVTYDQVKKIILALSAISRDATVALLSEFGAKNGSQLIQADYAKFLANAQIILDEVSK